MSRTHLHTVVTAAFFAAIDYLFAMFQFHIPSPIGHPFVDLGFTFVSLGVVFLGFKYGLLAGAVALFVFDLLNGYANHAYLTILEVFILSLVVALLEKLLQRFLANHPSAIFVLGLGAGLTKIATGYLRYLLEGLIDAGLPLSKAMVTAMSAFPADIATGLLMMVTIPVFFFALAKFFAAANFTLERH